MIKYVFSSFNAKLQIVHLRNLDKFLKIN